MPKMQKRFVEILRRVEQQEAAGKPLMRQQLTNERYFIDRGLLRLNWGKNGTPDANRLVWYLTDLGRKEARDE